MTKYEGIYQNNACQVSGTATSPVGAETFQGGGGRWWKVDLETFEGVYRTYGIVANYKRN